MNPRPRPPIIRDVAEDYLAWLKDNRTERYWKRQERIPREDVIPVIGDVTIYEATNIGIHSILSESPNLPPDQQKRASATYNALVLLIGWTQKSLMRWTKTLGDT